jgi:glycosyltransferase involved in cell wall biosynthesis
MDLRISVIIPAYNAAETILPCLLSLHTQAFAPHEIIIVDDGSNDNSVEIAKNCSTVIKNNRNKGAGGARNAGAAVASGEIFAFTDSDCILPPLWLQKISEAFKEDGVGAVAGGYLRHEGRSFIGNFAHLELLRRRKDFRKYVETAPSNNFSVRKDIFDAIGGFPELFATASAEDVVFSLKISRKCKIRWLYDNGIGHQFRETVKGYLAQQYRFARDTVVMYAIFPEIKKVRTHQGYLIYFEALLAALTLAALLKPWPWFLLGVFSLWCLNFPLFFDVYKAMGLKSTIKTAMFLPIRDLNWIRGIITGFFMAAMMSFKDNKINNAGG